MTTGESTMQKDKSVSRSMPAVLLRLEGLVLFVGATAVYFGLGYTWWVFPLFLLAPDLSAIGYLVNPRIGSIAYNLAHTIAVPLVLGLAGWWLNSPLAAQVALIWLAHIGMDRMVGYGLKYPDQFKHTHLDAI